MLKVLRPEILPCEEIYPTIKGMLDKWHGERIMLKIPHKKEAITEINKEAESQSLRIVNKSLSMFSFSPSYWLIILWIVEIYQSPFPRKILDV